MTTQTIRLDKICFGSLIFQARNRNMSKHHNRWRHNRFDLRTFAPPPNVFESDIQQFQNITIDEATTDSTWGHLLWLPKYSNQKSKTVKSSQSMMTWEYLLLPQIYSSQVAKCILPWRVRCLNRYTADHRCEKLRSLEHLCLRTRYAIVILAARTEMLAR